MAFCLSLFLTGCFSTKAAWHPYGERASIASINLAVDASSVAHGATRNITITGGSSFYSCAFVSSGSNQGSLVLSYVSSSQANCSYTAPDSGSSRSPQIRITDEKYPEKYKDITLYVPPSGEPDLTYGSNPVSGLPGMLISFAPRDALMTGFDTDKSGRLLVSGLAKGTLAGDNLGFVARVNTNGQLDTTFGAAGVHSWGPSPHCGTAAGTDIIDVSVKAERDGNGIRVAYSKGYDYLVRLDENGNQDTSFGRAATPGCTIMSDLAGALYDMKSFALDNHDNTWFGLVSSSTALYLTKVNKRGDAYIQSSPPLGVPANYLQIAAAGANAPIIFSKGDRNFVAVHAKRSTGTEYGFLVNEFDSNGSNVFAKSANGYPNGRIFIRTQHPAAPIPVAEPVNATSIQMDANGVIHIGAHSYYDDTSVTNADVGLYFRYRTSAWDTLIPRGTTGKESDLLTAQFTENFLTPPISTAEAKFGVAVTNNFLIGGYASLLQTNGAMLILGANSSDSFSSLAQATVGRFLPNGGSDSAFRGARGGESDTQVPLVNLTVPPGYNSGFYRGTLDADGKYITAGHFQVSGQKNKVWVARFWP